MIITYLYSDNKCAGLTTIMRFQDQRGDPPTRKGIQEDSTDQMGGREPIYVHEITS